MDGGSHGNRTARAKGEHSMWVMRPADRAELERYRATGLPPEDVERLAGGACGHIVSAGTDTAQIDG